MRRLMLPLVAACLLAAVGCARPAGTDTGSAPPDVAALRAWADDVADTWSASGDKAAWTTGFVPLQDLASVDGDLDPARARGFAAGLLRTAVALPATPPPVRGVVRFGGATLEVPLAGPADAYAQMRQGGEAPPCPAAGSASAPPVAPTSTGGPDTAVSSGPDDACAVTVTGARLGTTHLRTTRGEASVPAWRFTVEGSAAVLVRVAVAPGAIGPAPSPAPPPGGTPPPGMVAAQHLTAVDGARLAYALGIGACDEDVTPVVAQRPDVVVVGGGVRRAAGVCTEQLLIHEVEVTLDAPLGHRPVFDALTGQPLVLKGG